MAAKRHLNPKRRMVKRFWRDANLSRLNASLSRAMVFALIGGIGWLVVTGCTGKTEKFSPVGGKVTVDGKPLATGSVTFHPYVAKGNLTPHIPVGTVDVQGNYKLMTATKEGAPTGWYRVTVAAQEPIDLKNPYAPPRNLISPKFSDASTSGLEVEVVDQPAAGTYDLKLAP